jgi:hypothetical protein
MKTTENDSNVINIMKTTFISAFITFLKSPDKLVCPFSYGLCYINDSWAAK